jgi:serine protease Do
MRHRLWSVTLSGLTVAAGLLLLAPPLATAQQMEMPQMQMMSPGQAELIRGLLPSVVNITSFVAATAATAPMNAANAPATQEPGHPKTEQGSGFVIDPSGVILTNYHVIDRVYDIHVMFSDGVRVPGRILATAPSADLALVKIDTNHPLTVVRWADSDKVQIGDPVFAIGNPLGIGLSVSSGIVSALHRDLMDGPYDDFIQTDAAINHGNSGGPLFNRSGEVIGVDTAIISPTHGSAGLGFAIPSNDAKFIANLLLRDGQLRGAYFGFKIEGVTPEMAIAFGLPKAEGSIIASVHAGGPAASGGLQVGDVILHFDNQTPRDSRALARALAKSTIGQAVPFTVLRAGHEQTLQVTPSAWPKHETASASRPGQPVKLAMLVPANLGLSLSTLTPDRRARYGLPMHQTGVLIDGVAAGTDAFDRGLAPGDVVLRVQDTDVHSPQEVQAAVDAARAQHKPFIAALVLPKEEESRGPRWMALRASDESDRQSQ